MSMTPFLKTVQILGVSVSCTSRQDVLQIPLTWAHKPTKRTVLYVNAHCLNLAANNPDYRAMLNAADLVYADGISVVWAARFLGGCRLEKATGRDWVYDFCALAEKHALRLYILAGKSGVAQTAGQNLVNQFPGLQIIGTHSGYIDQTSTPDLIAKINRADPHLLMVGMGTPMQENWLAVHRDQIEAPVCWAVGALFDYIAGIECPVPSWLDRLNLEWLWRLLVNPAGKWHRYLIGNPVFLARILRQKLR